MNTEYGDYIRIGIASGQYPAILYKYNTLNSNFVNSIQNSYLWFNSFSNYNDPYEGNCNLRTNYTPQQISNWLNGLGFKAARVNEKQFASILDNVFQQTAMQTRVCCFTPHNDNVLMWAHYADSYKGVCVEYDVAALSDCIGILLPVKYEQNYPVVDYLNDPGGAIMQMLLTKSKDWEYEREYRAVFHSLKNNSMPIPIQAIRSIILGPKVDTSTPEYQNLMSILPPSITIRHCVPDEKSYKLNIV